MININKFKTTERMECSADTKLFFDDVYTNSTRMKKAQVETVQYGRSMIEMLGVLAIVGVLSVGGIAGYSKAMFKFKLNKHTEQITRLLHANFMHEDTLNVQLQDNSISLVPYIIAMNEVPEEMIKESDDTYIYDIFGNQISFQLNQHSYLKYYTFIFHIKKDRFETCMNLLNIIKINNKNIWRFGYYGGGDTYVIGGDFCKRYPSYPCLKYMTLVDFNNFCLPCKDNWCSLFLTKHISGL